MLVFTKTIFWIIKQTHKIDFDQSTQALCIFSGFFNVLFIAAKVLSFFGRISTKKKYLSDKQTRRKMLPETSGDVSYYGVNTISDPEKVFYEKKVQYRHPRLIKNSTEHTKEENQPRSVTISNIPARHRRHSIVDRNQTRKLYDISSSFTESHPVSAVLYYYYLSYNIENCTTYLP